MRGSGPIMESHNCLERLRYRQHDSIEPHGERFHDEWWECTICGNKFTENELAEIARKEN